MQRTPLLVLLMTTLPACESVRPVEPAGVPHRPRLSASAAALLECPPLPGVTARAITAGTGADLNGNGVVCDRAEGPAGLAPVLTTDDILITIPPTAEPQP